MGGLHADLLPRDLLALDLMEALDPRVDAHVLDWLRSDTFARRNFLEMRQRASREPPPLSQKQVQTAPCGRQQWYLTGSASPAPCSHRMVRRRISTAQCQPCSRGEIGLPVGTRSAGPQSVAAVGQCRPTATVSRLRRRPPRARAHLLQRLPAGLARGMSGDRHQCRI